MTDFKSLAELYNFIKEKHQSENFVLKKKKIVRKIINRNHNKIKDQDNHVVPSKRCSFCAFCDVFFMTVFSRWHSEDNLLVW